MKTFANGADKIRGAILVLLTLLSVQTRAVNVLTEGYDLSRSGANTSETILTPTNVATSFGRLFTNPVDGQVYAQPLYVQNLSISNGVHNVVFVCTESNSVWAFDADMPGVTYWHDKFGGPFTTSGCGDLTPAVGITGTPVIDPDSGTLYVDTKLQTGPTHQLHALDITTGSEKFGGPVTVSSNNFTASSQHQRPGLLLLSNVVYLGFGSHCDNPTYHGFMLGYNATNLSLVYGLNITPTGSQGAVWSGGMAPAVDTNGNIYVMTGNGTFDGVKNFSMCMLKLSPSLAVEDYAAPPNESSLSLADLDFGSGGGVLVPPHYFIGMGKDTNLFMADINNMGHSNNFAQIVFGAESARGDTVGKSPVYWQGPSMQYIFLMHSFNPTKAFQFTGSSITNVLGQSAFPANDRCGGLSLSANGTTNGVLWEIDNNSILRAYDAVNFPHVLWSGSIGSYVKMNCPTIANGKVYVGTASNLIVFGLTNYLYLQSGVSNPILSWAPGGTLLESTDLLNGPWTSVSNGPPFIVVPTNDQMFYQLSLP